MRSSFRSALFLTTLALALRTSATYLSGAAARPAAAAAASRRAVSAPAMALELPGSSFRTLSPFGGLFRANPEVLYESGTRVDLLMETLHLTKRRVSGGCVVGITGFTGGGGCGGSGGRTGIVEEGE